MKVAEKLIFLFKDADGFGSAIYGALRPNPSSSVQRSEESFELPLDRYGIADQQACGKIAHFVDSNGLFPGVPEQKLRGHLGSFGISGNLALQPMYTLSGGQKSRVAFAKITFKKPHLLLLDEPSNHLDLDAVEALIQGLLIFQGGILMNPQSQFRKEEQLFRLCIQAG